MSKAKPETEAAKNFPAFPVPAGTMVYGEIWQPGEGMTLRDYFAARAMNAYIQSGEIGELKIARFAYAQADAMLEIRAEEPTTE
jgi:hypothetical protein